MYAIRSYYVLNMAIGPDGIIFIGTEGLSGNGGIYAYSFTKSSSFTFLAHIGEPRASIGIAVSYNFV